MENYQQIIRIRADVRLGKPCIRDTRISVYDVLSWLACGMTINDITTDYPELTEEDIKACLAYAANRERNIRVA
ncbi:MAG TPA: DUF433 domain-containing protein [Chitinophagales bacterium]|nr:DUF433 domain-containing protein [Chitinophagales bacterium]